MGNNDCPRCKLGIPYETMYELCEPCVKEVYGEIPPRSVPNKLADAKTVYAVTRFAGKVGLS